MKTSPTTSSSESRFRESVLDVLHAQWRALGVPFHSPLPVERLEVIDPEALMWCSFEFLQGEPRLAEGVRAWIAANPRRIIHQRINRFATTSPDDPRTSLRNELFGNRQSPPASLKTPPPAANIGLQSTESSALFLRARDLLGKDCRSFLIIFLIGSERGIRLREVTNWTGYSYRSISEAATGWARAGVVRIQHGHCVLINPTPWRELLDCQKKEVVTIDWSGAYQASVDLLRTLSKARDHGFTAASTSDAVADEHPLIRSAIATTKQALERAAAGTEAARTPALALLREQLAQLADLQSS